MSYCLSEKTPKARKEHKCSWCNSTIKKGQRYTRETYVYDGELFDWLSCGKCQKYVDEMFNENGYNLWDEITEEDLYEFCKDKYGKTPRELVEGE